MLRLLRCFYKHLSAFQIFIGGEGINFFHSITSAFVSFDVVWNMVNYMKIHRGQPCHETVSKNIWQNRYQLQVRQKILGTFHPTKLGVKIRAEEWSHLQNPKHLMAGKYTSLIGLMSGVGDGLEFISLHLCACEMCQALLARSPLTIKAVGRSSPQVKLCESHTWSPTMVTKQELVITSKNWTAAQKAYQQLLK